MKSAWKIGVGLAVVLYSVVGVSTAGAQCGFPSITGSMPSRQGSAAPGTPSISRAGALENQDGVGEKHGSNRTIVGFWRVDLVSEGTPGIPDGTVIDNSLVQWHEDGTELMNSSRPPATGSFCMGVWEKAEHATYNLNHFGLSFDPGGNFVGPAQLRESVTVGRQDPDSYEGTFTIDQYDTSGNVLAHIQGRVTGSRITVDTPAGDLF